MSPNSLRVLAGAAAAVLTLLTAIAVGFASGPPNCAEIQGPAPVPSASASTSPSSSVSPTTSPTGGTFGEVPGGGTRSTPTEPPVDQAPPKPRLAVDLRCDDAAFAPGAAVTALVGTGLTALVVLALLMLAGLRRGSAPAGLPGPGAAPGTTQRVPAEVSQRLDADRAALVRACIYVRDRVTSRALSDRLAAALSDAGVSVVEPVGDRFDPARHEAGGATPSGDPTLTGTIAAVEVPGYVDRTGRVLRAPVVTVYQPGPGGPQQSSTHPTRRRTEENR